MGKHRVKTVTLKVRVETCQGCKKDMAFDFYDVAGVNQTSGNAQLCVDCFYAKRITETKRRLKQLIGAVVTRATPTLDMTGDIRRLDVTLRTKNGKTMIIAGQTMVFEMNAPTVARAALAKVRP